MLQAIQSFLLDLEIKGRADNTIKNYKLQLHTFYSWCMQTGTDYLKITPRQAKQYRDALYTADLSGKSINTMVGTLRTFYEYLMEEEQVQGNPILKNLRVREEPKYPAPLNEKEQHMLLEILESKEQHIKMAFRTMLASGIRVGEAAKLIKEDIRLDNNRVILFIRKAKGGKSRTVPVINREVALQLYEYAKEVPDEEPLFRVAKRTLQGHAERIKKNTGINFYSHRARHTFATNLLAKDTRLDVIQRVMGHADISTTRKYAETLNQDILSIAEPINIEANKESGLETSSKANKPSKANSKTNPNSNKNNKEIE